MRTFCFGKGIWMISIVLFCAFSGPAKPKWKIMTYNIHHGADAQENNRLEEMGNFFRNTSADIITLQEVDSVTSRSNKIDQMKVLAGITGFHYAFVRHFAFDGGAYGLGILSRFPIEDVRQFRLPLLHPNKLRSSTALIVATIILPTGQKLDVASAHFALDQSSRLQQAADCRRILTALQNPLLFTGDFNAMPNSPEISSIKEWAFPADKRSRNTFPSAKPVRKIDYIFAKPSTSIRFIRQNVFDVEYSDHCPAMATFAVK